MSTSVITNNTVVGIARDLGANGITGDSAEALKTRIKKYVDRLLAAEVKKQGLEVPESLKSLEVSLTKVSPSSNHTTDTWYIFSRGVRTQICTAFATEILNKFPLNNSISYYSDPINAFRLWTALRADHTLGELASHATAVVKSFTQADQARFCAHVPELTPYVFGSGAVVQTETKKGVTTYTVTFTG